MEFHDDCERFALKLFAVGLIGGVFIGILLSLSMHDAITAGELKSVGIKCIERCHNTQSNWNEIVWIKK